MADVAASQTALLAQFPLAGGAGKWGAQQIRNLIVSTTQFVNVIQYGADPTKVSDSTAAFNAACAASKNVLVPPGSYFLNNFQPPSGTSIIGFNALGFDVGTPLGTPQIFALNAATTNIINIDGKTDLFISGLNINGAGATTCNGVSAGGFSITLRDLTIHNCTGWGIGGSGGSGVLTTQEMFIDHCTVFACGVGIGDLLDAWVTSCNLSSNGTNMAFTAGNSGANNIVNTRFEWTTTGYGFSNAATFATPNPGSKVQFTNCIFDRNWNGAAFLNGCNYVQFTGCGFWRNGAVSASGSVSCQVQLTGASHINFTGCMSNFGQDDTLGVGNISPPVFARYSGTNSYISFVGNDLTGYNNTLSAANWFAGSAPTSNYIVSKNFGTGVPSQTTDV